MKIALKKDTLDLSVVIASLNEAANLFRLLPALREALDALGVSWEILVVDGDSRDGTQKVVESAGAVYVRETAPGYGAAVLRGIQEARGAHVLTMDADMSHPSEFIRALWDVRRRADIVIASRYVPGGYADQPIVRLALSRLLNGFFSAGLSIPVRDLSSGFRLYRKSLFDGMEITFTNFVILIEILLLAYGKGLAIREIPFHYRPRHAGSSKARIIAFGRDYLRLFYRVWKMRNSVDFPDYDWRAYDSRIWLQRYWQRKRHEIIMRFTPRFVATCDVGCGSSRILADLPNAVGVDVRRDKLAFMRRTNHLLAQADGLHLPFADASFDAVICSQVIEHIPEENGRLLDELSRILRPGGTLVLGTPDYDTWTWPILEWLYGKMAPGAYADQHVTHYSYRTLDDALRRRNYEILAHDYVGGGELIVQARKPAAAAVEIHEQD
ncbi:MAG TPA: glycosyltransferase [Candidatus Hydrogenedentes bacterium]|nr:glycosyltransferase [Candidatus Hydrogenedentota bacterium]HRT20993.1 glycosyltransferase [Candidatus Hydrogenedentota bacterium]HRT65822.1 glycosyltransferase [Candidatus Hydrogenedentota bacterium]